MNINEVEVAEKLSELFESTNTEGGEVSFLIDRHVIPHLRSSLKEADGVGLGDRFAAVLDQVRATVSNDGADTVRNLKNMMKQVLSNYVSKTQDVVTGRHIFHNGIMQGQDTMITVTAAGLLANALAASHPKQAMLLMQQIGKKMTGQRPMSENASAGAVGAGAIATGASSLGKKPLKRKESIFAEWNDLLDQVPTIELVRESAYHGTDVQIDETLIDPTTAELILAAHAGLSPDRRERFASKPINEMVRIAHRLYERGGIQLIVDYD